MREIDGKLAAWKASLCKTVSVGALHSRNPITHKWKAPFRSLTLRETVSWRVQDLLAQSLALYDQDHLLGARILLRSALESLAVLIFMNQLTRQVLVGDLGFHDFSEKTSILLLGSRDQSTPYKSLNIVTIFDKCSVRYPGVARLYGALSESAHPNYEGTCVGYSEIDQVNYTTVFKNKWKALYAQRHLEAIDSCMTLFYAEYNDEWKDAFEQLEHWIAEHDDQLEATKDGP